MPRTLKLTSPPMRGRDILHLQGILNDRLAHYSSRQRLKLDGIYGPEMAYALRNVGYIMGMEPSYARDTAIRLIEHPHMRTPVELHRASAREKARREQGQGNVGLAGLTRIAERYVGVHEHPANSNWGEPDPARWLQEFGLGPASWCGAFAGAMIRLAGGHVTDRVTYCPFIEADARTRTGGFDRFVSNHSEGIEPGWLALFNWGGGSEPEHVEIVKEVHGDHLICVGGNTGGTDPAWGGMVGVEYRPYSFTVGYARPRL